MGIFCFNRLNYKYTKVCERLECSIEKIVLEFLIWVHMEQQSNLISMITSPLTLSKHEHVLKPEIMASVRIWTQFRRYFGLKQAAFSL